MDSLSRKIESARRRAEAEKPPMYKRVPDFPINPPNVSTQVLSKPTPVKLCTADGQWVELWLEQQ